MNLRVGAAVLTRDGREAGLIRHILVDESTGEVAGLEVLRTDGQSGSYVVPIDLIEDSTIDTVYLRASIKELLEIPATVEDFYGDLPSGWQPAPGFGSGETAGEEGRAPHRHLETNEVRITENAEVLCNDGRAGRVSRLLVDDYTGEITSVVVSPVPYLGRDVEIPFAWVSAIEDGRLQLRCDLEALRSMPKPRTETT